MSSETYRELKHAVGLCSEVGKMLNALIRKLEL